MLRFLLALLNGTSERQSVSHRIPAAAAADFGIGPPLSSTLKTLAKLHLPPPSLSLSTGPHPQFRRTSTVDPEFGPRWAPNLKVFRPSIHPFQDPIPRVTDA